MNTLARNWGWVALRGVAALIFGVLTFLNPLISLAALVLLWGAFAFADGIVAVVSAIVNRRDEPQWGWLLFGGVVGIAAGVATFFMPGVTAFVLLYFIAAWAIIIGVSEIATAIRLREVITGEWLLALVGVLSILFGAFLFIRPGAGALAIVLWIGAYATLAGILLIALAFRLRRWARDGTAAMSA